MSLDTIVNKITDFLSGGSGGEPAISIPDPGALLEKAPTIARVLVMAGPVVMIVMGLLYFFAAPGFALKKSRNSRCLLSSSELSLHTYR